MTRFGFFLLALVLPLTAVSDPAVTNEAPVGPAAESPAQASWARVTAAADRVKVAMQGEDPSGTATAITQAQATLADFTAAYPQDPLRWDAKMLQGQLVMVSQRMNLPGAPSRDEALRDFDSVKADTTAPKKLRVQASLLGIMSLSPRAKTDQVDWDAMDARIEGLQNEFGGFLRASGKPLIAELRQQELQMLMQTGPEDRLKSLLKKLAADKDPQVVAAAAGAQAELDRMAEFKTKPVALAFTAVDGSKVDLAQMRGKVVLIDFWATWCGPCVAGIPEVIDTYKKYHDQGFEIVGISLDRDKDALLAFTKEKGMLWPQYFDGGGFDNKISKSFGIASIPSMWLVDQKGMLVSTEAGGDLPGMVENLLKSAPISGRPSTAN